jgi:hypothetical protein
VTPLRRAGRGRLRDGSTVVWSVSEGTRGRRWREIRRNADGILVTSLLLETHPDGRFAHIELSTAAGLLTLHPEGDGTLHGNIVTTLGIRHVMGLPWTPRSVVLVEGSLLASAAAKRTLASAAAADGVRITLGLDIVAIHETISLGVDADGLPLLDDAASWPLEAE